MIILLDANILFSAAYREYAGVRRLWKLKNVEIITSAYAVEEAKRNLQTQKQHDALQKLLVDTRIVTESPQHPAWAQSLLNENDAPIMAAAIGAHADMLITGDLKHFSHLFDRKDLPIRVCTVRSFLTDL